MTNSSKLLIDLKTAVETYRAAADGPSTDNEHAAALALADTATALVDHLVSTTVTRPRN
ncbi:hypothetical protein ACL02S_23820 [Nocardia sp. 004]|uniref:hypothetical protein n=1 Tax=Nocardia sp. 004 TaxID=3385978 RepID=UPI0039A3268D